MTTLLAGLSHVHHLLQRTDFTKILYATGKIATLPVTAVALRASRREHWGPKIRKLLTVLVCFARRRLAPGSPLGDVLGIREMRRQIAQREAMASDYADTRQQLAAISGNYAEVRRQLDVATSTIAHLRKIEGRYETMAAADREIRSGVQAFVDELQRMLFEVHETTSQSRSAAVLVAGNQPVEDTFATLVNLSEPAHGARPFQYVLPFLAPSVPFALAWPAHMAPLRVVDVGSQELDFEHDMFAPLRNVAPVEVIGFDPFAPVSGAPDTAVEVRRPDGGPTRTYGHLLADGGPVTFHVNRFDATSSTLPANHVLTRPFGLLDLALQTTETRELPSRRLDDTAANTAPVDLLKIDVQGAAYTVLNHGRTVLQHTLVCHVEAEFAPVYLGERLFAEIDELLREEGFGFVDFFSLGRQRYAAFEGSRARAFHRGRTLWADCIYVRGIDTHEGLTADELFRQALIMHVCYNKQDLTAELLGRSDTLVGGSLRDAYISNLSTEKTR